MKLKDKADLKVTAYDFSKYGKIRGEVAFISPGTVENDDKRTYYKVQISFKQDRSDRFAKEWHLQPGKLMPRSFRAASRCCSTC